MNKANSNHTHSNYALSTHTHSNYVTSTQVTSLVNTAISNGSIKVSGSMFKSVEHYKFTNNTTGITITGPGMVSVLQGYKSEYHGYDQSYDYYNGYVVVDGHEYYRCEAGSMFMFKNSLKLYTEKDNKAIVEAVVGVFN